ncbi:hypothetical protein CBS147353_11078 [Aspergillus niger]|nr:hypothetical protein CBS147353_11078 [Aspergillus niger]
MAVPAVDFPLFSRLPTELRVQIWEETLPKFVRPLYFYRTSFWVPEFGEGKKVEVKFDHRLLELEFAVPILFVNHEAYQVKLSRMKSQGIDAHATATKSIVFTRPFNPRVDTLYLSEDQFIDTFLEPVNLLRSNREIKHLATGCTEETVNAFLIYLFHYPYHRGTQKLIPVNNAEVLPSKGQESQQHWELSSTLSTPTFVWNNVRNRFEEAEGVKESDPELLRGLNRGAVAVEGMTDELRWDRNHTLEVHLATAIKM